MDLKKIEEISKKIKIQFSKKSLNFYLGAYRTLFRGEGISFRDHRPYNFEDDIRFLDWKIFAKTNRFYIKTFEEDRQLDIAVIIDARKNMQYGCDHLSKLRVATEITCLLKMMAERSKDIIRPFLVGDRMIECPAGNGNKSIENFIYILKKNQFVDDSGDFIPRYQSSEVEQIKIESLILKNIEKRRIVFILSDFRDFLSYETLIKIGVMKKVLLGRVISPIDEMSKFPYMITPLQKSYFPHSFRHNEIHDYFTQGFAKKLKWIRICTEDNYLDKFVQDIIYANQKR